MSSLVAQRIQVSKEQSQIIDGLRALAASYVALAHYKREFIGAKGVLGIFSTPAATGVLLFFVLSGLCIGLSHRSGAKWTSFYTRRVFRIFPAAWFCMAVVFFFRQLIQGEAPSQSELLGSAFLIPNTPLGAGAVHLNPPLWSLQTELELYLLFPLMLWAFLRFNPRVFLSLSLVSTAIAFSAWLIITPTFSYHGPSSAPCYLLIWNLGLAMAYGFRPKIREKVLLGGRH